MADEIERADITEFSSLSAEVRQAALEYARGLTLEGGAYTLDRQRQEGLPAPQFVIVGLDGGTLVFSEHVTDARMVRKIEGFDRVPIGPGPNAPQARIPRYVIALGVKLEDFQQHLGNDYPSALATLAGEWRRRNKEARERARHELPPAIG